MAVSVSPSNDAAQTFITNFVVVLKTQPDIFALEIIASRRVLHTKAYRQTDGYNCVSLTIFANQKHTHTLTMVPSSAI